jgi:DNA-binding NarL/FixJ family response regulator
LYSVVIIDDHDIVRFGVGMLIGETSDMQVRGVAATLQEARRLIAELTPDLVVTDMGTGDSQGLETVRQVVSAQSPRATIVMSMQDEILYGERVLALGALAYVMKETAHATLLPACRAALRGETWTSQALAARVVRRTLRHTAALPQARQLTEREVEVLELLKQGRTTKEIAASLGLSARTVDIHRSNIKHKLGLRTGAALIAYASSNL